MKSPIYLEVPEIWLKPENIVIGYYQNQLNCFVLIFIDQQKAIAIDEQEIKTVDWLSPDYLRSPKSIKRLEISSFE